MMLYEEPALYKSGMPLEYNVCGKVVSESDVCMRAVERSCREPTLRAV